MRTSNKSRSRNKNSNRNRSVGNIVNRVFDSSGPEGRVRGTPQQIIEKYQGLAHDAQLSNDRVAAENFQQHSEHYTRMLNEAQREMAERQANDARARADQPRSDNQQPDRNDNQQPDRGDTQQPARNDNQQPDRDRNDGNRRADAAQPDATPNGHGSTLIEADTGADDGGLVDTPESRSERPAPAAPKTTRSRSRTRAPAPSSDDAAAATPPNTASE